MNEAHNKTGIEFADYDKVQPWRVWWKKNIIWFARTKEEAERKLDEAKIMRNKMIT